ncbi:hypothetical protein [Winogradskyella ouciana]|uniref:hypothetical protein n=1 Tax=Winogradskyella ouciana TaxID=2608631 RepID=UPI003D2B894E
MEVNNKPPNYFWAVAIFAIVWNIIEIYFSSVEFNFLEKNSTVEEFERIQSLPIWYIAVFLVALFSEMLGSFMLFMRKKIATKFYLVSLIMLIFVEIYWIFFFDIKNTSTLISIVIPLLVITIAIFLYYFSKGAAKNDWIK